MQADHQYQYQPQQWQPQPQQSSYPYHQPRTLEEVRTLWIGDLQYWMDETYIQSCFAHTNEVVSVKIIRNKITGHPEGYGFIEFTSHTAAEKVLQTYSGTQMPQTEQVFRLNWASFGLGDKREAGSDPSIFVGDLAPDVTDYILQETFRVRYPSVKGAKVVFDMNTGRSKGYGFVRFGDESERTRAMTEMNGVYCSSRPMRISVATQRKPIPPAQQTVPKGLYQSPAYGTPPSASQVFGDDNDPNNTTIFVGGLDPNATEEDLRQVFGYYGELVYVKIPSGKGCGFVQYMYRQSAEEALQKLHGAVIGQQSIRLSWGRSMVAKPTYASPTTWSQDQWSAAYYGYAQGYDGYTYGTIPQDGTGDYSYAGYYANYPQQIDAEAMAANAYPSLVTPVEEEVFDPLAPPDVDKLNDYYIAVHEPSAVGQHLWIKTSEQIEAV